VNKISVVIPAKEEMGLGFHRKIIESYRAFPNCELIWVVGPNNDGTYQELISKKQTVIQTESNSRAERINIGIRASQHSLIIINHPRSFLTAQALAKISSLDISKPNLWGGFTHAFYQSKHPILKFTSFYSNLVRFGLCDIIYLDHCIYLTRDLFDSQDSTPVPAVDIFEDTLLSKKLSKLSRPKRIKEISYTSPIRFTTNGIFKQSMMNQKLKLKHFFGFSTRRLNEDYERNLNLNSEY